jgi:polysaccharide pyruvyl transferase WcaK-like protein
MWDLPAPRVAVALRPHPNLTEARLDQFTQSPGAFQTATDACILLVPFQPSKDLPIAEYIQPRLPGPNQIYILQNPRQLKGVFRGVEMTIGMRFHALNYGGSRGVPLFCH